MSTVLGGFSTWVIFEIVAADCSLLGLFLVHDVIGAWQVLSIATVCCFSCLLSVLNNFDGCSFIFNLAAGLVEGVLVARDEKF